MLALRDGARALAARSTTLLLARAAYTSAAQQTATSAAQHTAAKPSSSSPAPRVERPVRRTVLIDGTRTPFCLSGTAYSSLLAVDLARAAIHSLVVKTAVDPGALDGVILGTVIQEVRTSNLAREAALAAGIPDKVPAHTVTQACISSNQAAAQGAALIEAGLATALIVGGAETMSDVPIRLSRPLRQRLLRAQKGIKGPGDVLKLVRGLRLGDLAPEAPAIAEFSTGEVMGHSSDRLASAWGVTRQAQDDFAFRSHQLAAAAHRDGKLAPEITPLAGAFTDNGIKGDAPREKLSTLKPAFVRPHGTHTAGNSSFLTDGASAALLMDEARARAEGLAPKARVVDWLFVSQDPRDELLLGPAYAVSRLLARHGLAAGDVAVWELHEAFAGQVLANLAALDSASFAARLGVARVGALPMERVNAWGGSLSLGHPFGATGVRLITTAANRLRAEDGRLAVLAACAAGGQGTAMLLERL